MLDNPDEVIELPVGDVTLSGFIMRDDLLRIERGERVTVLIYHAVGAGVELGTLRAVFEDGGLKSGPVPHDLAS
ncbi:hypothetical protein [Deinococcus yavapaiensis]|uniref:Uncharacterized protein n=1 Tax=Deinococcus yavapaiensis KR-236 TaxID=694435 RepID=A0A318S4G2_9DEIO|nr:hypothetical protein [Deinococcus yavapaiensis]PYE51948.1 hypothetical protein DES52_114149 [Deinococcus yavapaiensis KR-236]